MSDNQQNSSNPIPPHSAYIRLLLKHVNKNKCIKILLNIVHSQLLTVRITTTFKSISVIYPILM